MEIYYLSPLQVGLPGLGEEDINTLSHMAPQEVLTLSLIKFSFPHEDYIEPISYSTIGRPLQNWVCLRTLADVKL